VALGKKETKRAVGQKELAFGDYFSDRHTLEGTRLLFTSRKKKREGIGGKGHQTRIRKTQKNLAGGSSGPRLEKLFNVSKRGFSCRNTRKRKRGGKKKGGGGEKYLIRGPKTK